MLSNFAKSHSLKEMTAQHMNAFGRFQQGRRIVFKKYVLIPFLMDQTNMFISSKNYYQLV